MLSLKGTIKEYGVLSEMVYKENPIDYLTSGLLTDSYQLLKSQKNYLTGFYSVLLKNINTEEYVLVFRGTSDPFDISSWYGEKTPQYYDAVKFVSESISEFKIDKSNLTLTGHSLGGILTAQIGLEFGIKGYAYNPFGANLLSYDNFKEYSAILKDWAEHNIYTISYQDEGALNGDILSNALTNLAGEHLGSVILVFGKDAGWDFLTGHSIVNLNKYIEEYNNILKHFNSNITYKELTEAYLSTAMVYKGKGYEKLNEEFKKLGVFNAAENSLNLEVIIKDSSISSIFSNSSIPIENLYALVYLNPFMVTNIDSPAYKELEKYKDEYSDNYIKDKTVMFKKALDGKAAINGIYFKDYESNLDLDTTQDFNGMYDEYHFGTNSNDTIEPIGTKISLDKNRIYALGGDDHIKAPNGSNYIEAGSGNDTISRVFF